MDQHGTRWSPLRRIAVCCWAVLSFGLFLPGARGEDATIEMELVREKSAPVTSSQEWYKLLTSLKVESLRIRSLQPGDEPGIDVAGAKDRPRYRVRGLITANNVLRVPGGKFGLSDVKALTKWLATLRSEGPDRAQGGDRLPFGMSAASFTEVHEDLAKVVDQETLGLPARDVADAIAGQLKYRLILDQAGKQALKEADPVTEELKGIAAGTALSYVLRSAGLILQPASDKKKGLEYRVVEAAAEGDLWPVGWAREAKEVEILPAFFETRNVEIEDVPLAEVLAAIQKQLNLPILYDHYALILADVDLSKAQVNFPRKRTNYAVAVGRWLAKSGLKYEVRLDDADRPFLWIMTQIPPK